VTVEGPLPADEGGTSADRAQPSAAGARDRRDEAVDLAEVWERHAGWWQAEFTAGTDVEYVDQILPVAGRQLAGAARVLDLGCGEGQIARLVANAGARRAVGIDASAAQIAEAGRRAGGPAYARALATDLPLAPGSFDAVVSCLVLEHVADLDAALDEVSRVLRPGGRFVLLLNHPLFQTPGSGWIDDHVADPPEQYWRVGPYLPEDLSIEEVDDGVRLPFFHRPLSRYVNALADRGLHITRMLEPAPPARFVAMAPQYADAATIPRLLMLRAEMR
jgi:SAM-dependent methyltransferase